MNAKEIRESFRQINLQFMNRFQQVDSSDEFYIHLAKPLRTSIRVNTLKAEVNEVVENLSRYYNLEQVPWCKEGFFIEAEKIGSTLEHQLGLIFAQEASSMIPAIALDVRPKMLVLDVAASPGAKTTQIAQYMENEGCIIANDVKVGRLNVLISNLQRCGVLITKVTMKDGRYFRRFLDVFDAVLLDAPCSNVGMVRKSLKYLKIWRKKNVESLSKLQKQLIMSIYTALKPNGVLVYSTCTLDPAENEEVIDHLLSNSNAKLKRINLPVKSHEPILEFDGKQFDKNVKKCLRIHPQDNDTEGFFVAKVIKND
jgi:NOL1/NOP2/sun family putative RNA methylase